MALFAPSPQTSTSSGTSTTTFNPSQGVQNEWNNIVGTAGGLANAAVNNYVYPGQMVAGPTDLMNEYWGQAGAVGQFAPNVNPQQNALTKGSGDMYNTQVNPSTINLPQYSASSFQPGQFSGAQFGATPTISAPGALTTSMYQPQQVEAPASYTPQQVQAAMVSAPGAVRDISGIAQVQAPNLQNYQMGSYANVNAPNLQNFTMQAAPNVSAGQTTMPQSWNDPGTAASYMSPYVQQVVNAQLAQAQTQEQQQIQQQNAQAAQAGAFGGSRAAVENANTSIGYQQLAAQLQAQGLQNAYTAGTQQFNTQQQANQQAQQFNVQSGLQAALANQQAQQQANVQNLSAYLQTQGLGAQTGLQAQLANQQAGLTTNQANLQSNLQTQQLGAQTGLQAALANQSMNYQTQLANQQAQEFGYGQQLQAGLANQQAGLTAQQLNQSAGLQSALASMGYQYGASQANAANALQSGLQNQQLQANLGMFGAGQQMTASQANQAAQMQAQMANQQAAQQAGLQTQNLGLSGAEYGGQLGLQSAQAGYGLQQNQQGLNMQALMNQGSLQNQAAQLGLAGYNAQLQGVNALQQAGTSAQGYQQSVNDAAYQQWINSMAIPMQAEGYLANITGMQQQPYSTTQNYSGTSTMMPAQQSIFSQAFGAAMGGLGMLGGLGVLRKGGPVGRATGGLGGTLPARAVRTKLLRYPAPEARGLAKVRLMPAVEHEPHGLARAA